jgi:hypothetical protein
MNDDDIETMNRLIQMEAMMEQLDALMEEDDGMEEGEVRPEQQEQPQQEQQQQEQPEPEQQQPQPEQPQQQESSSDVSNNVFQLGRVLHIRPRPRPRPRLRRTQPTDTDTKEDDAPPLYSLLPFDWSARLSKPVEPGKIRLFDDPLPTILPSDHRWWTRDRTLTEWITDLQQYEADVSNNPLASALGVADSATLIKELFAANQRKRWLARVVFHRWTQFVWRKRTQCNIDLIEMEPIKDADAIFLTDTRHHQIYRFHRRDVFNNLLSNLSMADEFLPTPRPPTNPWTNAPLTEHQIIGLCAALVADYGRRGRCPPVLFAAYCASRFNLRRFQKEHASLLAQQAIMNFFKDLNDHTVDIVFDTMMQLINDAALDVSPIALRRWLRETPPTKIHRAWLNLVRDYTLYINLHIQVRPHWTDETAISADVRTLFRHTTLPDPTSARIRHIRNTVGQIRNTSTALLNLSPPPLHSLGLPLVLRPPAFPPQDASGSLMEMDLALQLIQQALFRH